MAFYMGVKNDFETVKNQLSEIQIQYEENRDDFEKRKADSNGDRVHDDNEELYYKMRDIFNGDGDDNIHEATVYYFINKTAYSGMIRYNKQGKFNVPYGRYKNFNTNLVTYEHHELLKNSEIFAEDYSSIYEKAKSEDYMLLDPPYDCVFSDYGNKETKDGFTDEMHRKLAEDFKKLKCKALLVISKTPLIEELYGDMIVHEYEKSYAVNIRNRFKSEALHVLITNYEV